MATFNKFNSFVEALAHGEHDLASDQLSVALTNSLPSASDEDLGDISQISYTNLSSRNVTTSDSSQTSGTYKLTLADLTLTSSGGTTGPFQYVVLYNDTSSNDLLIGFYNYGSELTLGDGEGFTIDFNASSGALTIV